MFTMFISLFFVLVTLATAIAAIAVNVEPRPTKWVVTVGAKRLSVMASSSAEACALAVAQV